MHNKENGWVKLHRKLLDWEWSDDPNMMALWMHILLNANYENARWHGIELEPGQLIFGRQEWSKKTGISEQTLRTCISRLKSTGQLTSKSTSKFSVLTIVKWDFYQQILDEPTSQSTGQLTSNQPATNQQPTTDKEIISSLRSDIIKNNTPYSPPQGVDDGLWKDFLDQRKKNKCSNTERALKMLTKKITDIAAKGHDPNTLVETAYEHGWKTVYEPKEKIHAKTFNNRPSSFSERQAAATAESLAYREELKRKIAMDGRRSADDARSPDDCGDHPESLRQGFSRQQGYGGL